MERILTLTGPAWGPADRGAPRRLVVLLHGRGADGGDLIALAPLWGELLPGAAFLAPDAPFPCDMAPFGRQWFSLQDRSPAALLAGVRLTAPLLDAFLDDELMKRNLTDERLALVGFSQGTMMALHVALRRARPCAGVLGYSGALIGADRLAAEIRARPRVCLIHGEADELIPVTALPAAEQALRAASVPVEAHTRPRLGHGIDEEGARLGGRFLASVLAASGG